LKKEFEEIYLEVDIEQLVDKADILIINTIRNVK